MLVSISDIVFHDDTSHHLESYSICSNAVSKCQDENFQFITYLDISGYRNSQLAWEKITLVYCQIYLVSWIAEITRLRHDCCIISSCFRPILQRFNWLSVIFTIAKQAEYTTQLFTQSSNKREFRIELQIKENLEQIHRQRWLRICWKK